MNTGSATMQRSACQRTHDLDAASHASTSTPPRSSAMRVTAWPVCRRSPSGPASRFVSQPLPSGQVSTPSRSAFESALLPDEPGA